MTRLLRRFDAWWCAPLPAERLAVLRLAIGGFAVAYLSIRLPELAVSPTFGAARFEPVGPVALLDAPLSAALVHALAAAALAAGAAFAAGWRFRVSGPLFAALLLWVTSYRSSWGMIFHTENLMVLHVAVLGLAPAADALSLDARRCSEPLPADGRHGWPLRLMALLTVATYAIAGLAKLESAGWDWISGDVLRQQIAWDNLRKLELGGAHSPVGVWLLPHARLFPALALFSLAVELGAPLALLGGRAARIWAAACWLFHAGVLALMAILFPYPLAGCAFLPLLLGDTAARSSRSPAPAVGGVQA